MGVLIHTFFRLVYINESEHFYRSFLCLFFGTVGMKKNSFHKLMTYGIRGVKRGHGVLENDRNLISANGFHNLLTRSHKLLTVKHVEASFVFVRIGDIVNISARSAGGINVQLILEACGGGGHFEMAGAQMRNASLREAISAVKKSINAYLDEKESKKEE